MTSTELILRGQTAVVTGGASGIGRATALLLAENGANVVVGDFDFPSDTDAEFDRLGVVRQACDVRDEEAVRGLIAKGAELGELAILVNNAGIGMVKQIPDVSREDWNRCLDTNLTGAFLCSKHAIGLLRGRGGGSIVNISSNAGLLPRAHDPVYSTSKGALVAFTKSLALCHAADRIRVNAVCPGPVGDTRMMNADLDAATDRDAVRRKMIDASPLARAYDRMIDPREVAAAVLYLVSEAAAMVTGTMIAIDGGKSLGVPPQ